MLFTLFSQVLFLLLSGHLSQHAKVATAEGLTFADPIHKKSARNLNLYNFCHSPKKLAAVSPFRYSPQNMSRVEINGREKVVKANVTMVWCNLLILGIWLTLKK
jgi:hypothetical protein